MESTEKRPFELPKKLRSKYPKAFRASAGKTDFVFEPGKVYEDLPANEHLFTLWKQGFFEEVLPTFKKADKPTKPIIDTKTV